MRTPTSLRSLSISLALVAAGCGGPSALENQMAGLLFNSESSGTTTSLTSIGLGLGINSQNLYAETGSNGADKLVLRFANKTWSPSSDRAPEGHCLTCKTPLTAIAGGVSFTAVGHTVQHYDTNQQMWITENTGLSTDVLALWGSDSGVLVAVGDGGAISIDKNNVWTVSPTPTKVSLRAVWGDGPTDIYAVGDGGTVLRYDGNKWSSEGSGTVAALHDVWGSATYGVFAVGDGGTILHRLTL